MHSVQRAIFVTMISGVMLLCACVSLADEVVVAVDNAPLKIGSEVIGRAKRGNRLTVLRTNGAWLWVEISGAKRTAWIHQKHVEQVSVPQQELTAAQQVMLRRAEQFRAEADAIYESTGRRSNVVGPLQKAVEIYRQVHGDKHEISAVWMNNLAQALKEGQRYAEAYGYFEAALAARLALSGENHLDTALLLRNFGNLLLETGRTTDAAAHLRRSWHIRRDLLGEEHGSTLTSKASYALSLTSLGQHRLAMKLQEEVLADAKVVFPEKHGFIGFAMHNLAASVSTGGDKERALGLYSKSLKLHLEQHGENHYGTAGTLQNMASLYHDLGDHALARAYHERALRIRQKVEGPNHPATARSHYNLGLVLLELGNTRFARQHIEQSLAIRRKLLGDEHPDTAKSFSAVGTVLQREGDLGGAIEHYRFAHAAFLKTYGDDHPQVAQSYDNLGFASTQARNWHEARDYFERALAIRQAKAGSNSWLVARSLDNIGKTLFDSGSPEKAIKRFEQSVAIYEHLQHANLIDAYDLLGNASAALGRWDDAVAAYDRYARLHRTRMVRVMPTLSEVEQLQFFNLTRSLFFRALNIGVHRINDPMAAAHSAAWLINSKAAGHEAIAFRQRMNNADARDVLVELKAVRQELAHLSIQTPAPGVESAHQQKLDQLRREEHVLVRKMGDLTIGEDVTSNAWVTLNDFRDALRNDTIYVSFFRMPIYHFHAQIGAEWGNLHYVGWIVPPAGRGPVKVLDFGPADTIDAAIRSARETLQLESAELKETGELAAEKRAINSLRDLSRLIADPLAEAIKPYEHLALCPDALLWLVPWAALTLDSEKYLVEDHDIRYVVSGRELVSRVRQYQPSDEHPVIFADPDYNGGRSANREFPDANQRNVADRFATLRNVPRLAATAAEARAIRPSIESLAKQPAQLYMSVSATEAAFKELKRPSILAVSTHGFFFKDQPLQYDARGAGQQLKLTSLSDQGAPIENPLLRCGLLLAGCNNPDTSPDDGVLTGLEVISADLRGTELVVLSACETGVGEARNGEGVAGLRQAFQLAGAESVVSTLWQIPDVQSARLMTDFFKNLASGQDKAVALRQAQLARIKSRRQRYGAAHPFFWAAFTLTGQR